MDKLYHLAGSLAAWSKGSVIENEDGKKFVIEFSSGDRLSLIKRSEKFAGFAETTLCCITYGEKIEDTLLGTCYMSSQTEYFAGSAWDEAVDAFIQRADSSYPFRATGLGHSVEELCVAEAHQGE